MNKPLSSMIDPILRYDPDKLLAYADNMVETSKDDIEYNSWRTIQRIARFMKFADFIFSDEFEKKLKEE